MIELGLSRISQLIERSPRLTWRAIHIAGTNGKGSVAAYLSALLTKRGFETGRFTSPHLIDRWDCIAVNDRPISKSLFLNAEGVIKQRNEEFKIGASEFELLTATAFEVFHQARVSIGVIEVGLGGRLDATNVLRPEQVILSIITKIGLDHQTLLGDTLTAIAREKGGIIKPGVPCLVDGTNAPEVLAALEECAARSEEEGAHSLFWTTPRQLRQEEREALEAVARKCDFEAHQLDNLRLVVDAISYVQKSYAPSNQSLATLIEHVSEVHWPGRLQNIDIGRLVNTRQTNILLDGAHNIQSAEVLSRHVQRKLRQQDESVTWVLSMSMGKSIEEMLGCLLQTGDTVIATQFGPVDGMPWVKSVAAADIVSTAERLKRVTIDDRSTTVGSVEEAMVQAANIAKGGPLVVAGSLYLVSDVLRLLRNASRPECDETGGEDGE